MTPIRWHVVSMPASVSQPFQLKAVALLPMASRSQTEKELAASPAGLGTQFSTTLATISVGICRQTIIIFITRLVWFVQIASGRRARTHEFVNNSHLSANKHFIRHCNQDYSHCWHSSVIQSVAITVRLCCIKMAMSRTIMPNSSSDSADCT